MANNFTYKDQLIAVGDRIVVKLIVKEDDKSRVQLFDGLLIAVKGRDINKSIIVRKIGANSVGVERILPLASPSIQDIEVKSKGNVRRAKLYYLRDRIGRLALRVKTKSNASKAAKKEAEEETKALEEPKEAPKKTAKKAPAKKAA
jgi:large subunit ribosomal protein L19